jgi:hypothetical protein
MACISGEQMSFLKKHSIPLSQVFDASGLERQVYQATMHELDMLIAIGVSPCGKFGHTMKWRTGHCAQCNTQGIAFSRRLKEPGDVYVAESRATGLVKIGSAGDVHARIATLNHFGYGGVNDWRIRYYTPCNQAGSVEFEAQQLLKKYRTSISYLKSGTLVDCQELFECEASFAHQAVEIALGRLNIGKKEKIPGISSLGMFGINPLPPPKSINTRSPTPPPPRTLASPRTYKASKIPFNSQIDLPPQKCVRIIEIKGRIFIHDLAELMDVQPTLLSQDLKSMNLEVQSPQGELIRSVASALCKKHGFTLRR